MRVLVVLTWSLLSAGIALAQGGIELESFLWRPDLTATVRSVDGDASADPGPTTLDLEADLGMQDDDAFDTRLTFHIGPRSRVRLAWVDLDTTGDGQLARTVEFDGRTYDAGTRVVSTLRIDYGRVGWTWEFAGNERVRLGSIVEAKWVEIDTVLHAPDLVPSVDEADSLSALLPAVGLALDVAPGQLLGLFAEVTGIAAGDRGHLLDGEVGVRLTPTTYLTLVGGYRMLDVRIEDDGDLADFEDAGPYLGLRLQF